MVTCPHCSQAITSLNAENMPVKIGFLTSRQGLVYSCPLCGKFLSCEIDTPALKSELFAQIRDEIQKVASQNKK